MRERTFWRTTAWTLAVLLLGGVVARATGAVPVPPEAIALAASTLFCLGVARTVVAPRSSLVRLDAAAERTVRRRQVGVGLAISAALALLLLVPEVQQGPTPWVLAPVIALGPVLAVREALLRGSHDAPERRP